MENLLLQAFDSIKTEYDIMTIVRIGIVVLLTIAVYIALVVVRKRVANMESLKSDLRKKHFYITVIRIAKILTIVIGVIALLNCIGINLAGLTTIIAVFVLVFVLAFKDSLQDIFAGLIITADKYFSVGDAVEFDGKDGIVTSFTVRTTKITCLDDRSIMSVSNRNISKIRKLTHLVDIDFPLAYELPQKDALELLSKICEKIAKLDGVESCELKGIQNFGDHGVFYKIRFFCEPINRPDIRRAVLKTLYSGLEEADVHIPYHQIDIHNK